MKKNTLSLAALVIAAAAILGCKEGTTANNSNFKYVEPEPRVQAPVATGSAAQTPEESKSAELDPMSMLSRILSGGTKAIKNDITQTMVEQVKSKVTTKSEAGTMTLYTAKIKNLPVKLVEYKIDGSVITFSAESTSSIGGYGIIRADFSISGIPVNCGGIKGFWGDINGNAYNVASASEKAAAIPGSMVDLVRYLPNKGTKELKDNVYAYDVIGVNNAGKIILLEADQAVSSAEIKNALKAADAQFAFIINGTLAYDWTLASNGIKVSLETK